VSAARTIAHRAEAVKGAAGYVSQQNFDSQWISTSGKDALNSVGVGAFFNVMNTGQMLLWHVVLLPVVLIALTGAHVLLVRLLFSPATIAGITQVLPATRTHPVQSARPPQTSRSRLSCQRRYLPRGYPRSLAGAPFLALARTQK
jgi:hypothetical protein